MEILGTVVSKILVFKNPTASLRFIWLLVQNHREPVQCGWRIWLIVPVHVGYRCPVQVCLCVMRAHSELFLSLTSFLCVPVCVCVWRLCVCDMDRLGRNEFIGEVRVALKKLKEGENKRYNMGLERIAQVHTHIWLSSIFLWICEDIFYYFNIILFCFKLCPIVPPASVLKTFCNTRSSSGSYIDSASLMSNLSNFRIKKPTIKQWSRVR